MADYAAYQVDSVRELFGAYESLPIEERGLDHFVAQTPGAGYHSSGSFLYVFPDIQFHKSPYTQSDGSPLPGNLSFASDRNTIPFLAMPVGMWQLEGRPDGLDYDPCAGASP